ncbi:MAG: hypothetical protein QE263_04440 [Vampirovibrionales bacterium]|nr:hypothetical protein [Vampirovibrionales bacterium]
MNTLTSTGPASQFGWFQSTHHAIRQGGVTAVAQHDFKRYLQQNEVTLGLHDDAQDQFKAGPAHYINLEDARNESVNPYSLAQSANSSKLHIDSYRVPWPDLMQRLSLDKQQQLAEAWQVRSLKETDLPKGTTAYDSVLHHTNQLIAALATPHPNATSAQLEQAHQLVQYHAGALAHYVGDIYMPLHSTHTFNWSLAPNYANLHPDLGQGIHAFIEGDVLKPGDYAALQQEALVPMQLSKDTLKPFLLEAIQASHLRVFDLLQANQHVVMADPYRVVNRPTEFKAALRQALLPLVKSQVLQAQQAYGAILSMAFEEAQRFENAHKQYELKTHNYAVNDTLPMPAASQPLPVEKEDSAEDEGEEPSLMEDTVIASQ